MNWYEMSDEGIIRELGKRIKQARLNKNLSQQDIANRTGLNRSRISLIEGGEPSSMQSFIAILRAVDELDNIDSFLAEPPVSPIQMMKLTKKKRQRASGHRGAKNEEEGGTEW